MLKIESIKSFIRNALARGVLVAASGIALAAIGCGEQEARQSANPSLTESPSDDSMPGPTTDLEEPKPSVLEEIPRFGANSPFDDDHQSPIVKEGKRLWAQSFRWEKAPELNVEQWLGEEPDIEGKYVLVAVWATWCSQCRRSIPLLNGLHHKFGENLVVIGVSDESAAEVLEMKEPPIDYFSGIDTQGRLKEALGVFGVPHVIILEPEGYVVWEGFPLQPGYELTEEIVEKILAVGRKLKAGDPSGK